LGRRRRDDGGLTASGSRTHLLAALLAGTLVLRPQLTAVGPLLPDVQADLGVSHALAGLLVTVPVLCMGLFALPAARVLRRAGARTAIHVCLVAIAAATSLRAVAPGFAGVLALTFPFGIAAGVMGALLPAVVQERFAERPAFGTGVFALGLNAGASLGAGLAVPLATLLGGWRWSLGVLAVAGACLVPAWHRLSRDTVASAAPMTAVERLPWRSPLAWAATLLFGLQALCFFGLNAWLADAMVERGWEEEHAGALVALLNIAAVPSVVLVALLAGRRLSLPRYLGAAAAALVLGTAALTRADGSAWVWITLVSLALGSLFALSMTVPAAVTSRPAEAAAFAAMQLGVGYVLAATAPFVLGALRDASGGYDAGLWIGAVMALLVAVSVVVLRRLLPENAAYADTRYYGPMAEARRRAGGS
jgi:CP family cyanate transporter-like MFS transporter